jgi:hypothetical protein
MRGGGIPAPSPGVVDRTPLCPPRPVAAAQSTWTRAIGSAQSPMNRSLRPQVAGGLLERRRGRSGRRGRRRSGHGASSPAPGASGVGSGFARGARCRRTRRPGPGRRSSARPGSAPAPAEGSAAADRGGAAAADDAVAETKRGLRERAKRAPWWSNLIGIVAIVVAVAATVLLIANERTSPWRATSSRLSAWSSAPCRCSTHRHIRTGVPPHVSRAGTYGAWPRA